MTISRIKLAPKGPEVSRLVFGVMRLAEWQLSRVELLAFIKTLLEMGLTTFDHADIYGDYTCEQLFGEAVGNSSSLREKTELVTKCNIKLVSPNRPEHTIKHYDTSRAHIIASAERSLKNLRTDYLDVLLIHRPDPLMNPDEMAEAFTRLREAGKVLYFGVSNFSPAQFDLLQSRLDFPLVTNQIELSVMQLKALHDGTVDQCLQRRISPMAWSSLGGARLFTGDSEQAVRLRTALAEVGQAHGGASIDQVALAWLLRHPANIAPILGTGNLRRVKSAAQSESLTLSREQWFAVWRASTGGDVP